MDRTRALHRGALWAIGLAVCVVAAVAALPSGGLVGAATSPSALDGYGLTDTWPLPADLPGSVDGALSISPMPDGRLAVLAAASSQILAVDSGGSFQPLLPVPDGDVQDLASSADRVFVSTDKRVTAFDLGGTELWSQPCNCPFGGGRLHAGRDAVWVSEPRDRSVVALDPGSGAEGERITVPRAFGLWPSDVAGSLDVRVTAEFLDDQLQRWRAGSTTPETWSTGTFDGPSRLAYGQLSSGTSVIGALFANGEVRLYDAGTNGQVDSFELYGEPGDKIEATDMAILADGRVVVADRVAYALRVYSPGAPTPTPESTGEPPRTEASCTVTGTKSVAPARIYLGDSATISLTLQATCPKAASGADVILLTDRSISMRGQRFESAVVAGISFAFHLDPRVHRIGVAAFSNSADIVFPLSNDQSAAIAALEALKVISSPDGDTNLDNALAVAQAELAAQAVPGRAPVVVLLSDGEYGTTPDPRPRASAMRDAGVAIYVVGFGSQAQLGVLRGIAGTPERVFLAPTPDQLLPAYREILLRVTAGLAGQLTIVDEMGPEIDFVPGSANPTAIEGPRDLTWRAPVLPLSGMTMTYEIRPRSVGLHATNERAVANYLDADGYRRSYTFPAPEILVEIKPTPRPPEPLYLPVALKEVACVDRRTLVNVALVVDASSSMLEPSSGGGTKLDSAVQAVTTFIDRLSFANGDLASIVSFNSSASILQSTTSDRAALVGALSRLEVSPNTRIDLGIETAHGELFFATPPEVRPVMVVLTDGRANPVPADVAVQRAAEAKADGIEIYTIGLGDELDAWALEQIATDPSHFLRAPDASALAAVYEAIAKMVPCDNRG